MQKITITVDDETMAMIDRLATKFSLDRSSTIRASMRALGIHLGLGVDDGVQTESGEDTERT